MEKCAVYLSQLQENFGRALSLSLLLVSQPKITLRGYFSLSLFLLEYLKRNLICYTILYSHSSLFLSLLPSFWPTLLSQGADVLWISKEIAFTTKSTNGKKCQNYTFHTKSPLLPLSSSLLLPLLLFLNFSLSSFFSPSSILCDRTHHHTRSLHPLRKGDSH